MSVPTIEQELSSAYNCNGYYEWNVEGGVAVLDRDQLLPALEAAYDPYMEAWPTLVEQHLEF